MAILIRIADTVVTAGAGIGKAPRMRRGRIVVRGSWICVSRYRVRDALRIQAVGLRSNNVSETEARHQNDRPSTPQSARSLY